ncbi:hypothetical protein ACFY2K_12990 [Kitasatospora sp. NPDC001309]|uniref:hypothetical protein n=1 Tax=Kitasatospora sp. NPDC001309 TaxID=3364013 RepID=UPI00368983E3
MRFRVGRRTAAVTTAAALSVGALVSAVGNAHADDYVPINVGHWVGLYDAPNTSSKDGWADVPPGGAIIAQCWTVGESIGNYGDTWYRTNRIFWNDGHGWTNVLPTVYVFAGYADGNARSVDRDPNIPRCPS